MASNRSRAGRPRKPTNLKLVTGTQRKDRENPAEPQFKAVLPDPPAWLPKDAKEEWKRLGPKLLEAGLISEESSATFSAYCLAWARLKQAEKLLGDDPKSWYAETEQGTFQQHPIISIAAQLRKQVVDFAREFGLSPSSAGKVTAKPTEEAKDPLEALRNRKSSRAPKNAG
jgi:P27 family predicted phage terminase small subunit